MRERRPSVVDRMLADQREREAKNGPPGGEGVRYVDVEVKGEVIIRHPAGKVVVKLGEITGSSCRLCVHAPRSMPIVRGEDHGTTSGERSRHTRRS